MDSTEITDERWECQRKEFRVAKALEEKGVVAIHGKQGDALFDVSLRAGSEPGGGCGRQCDCDGTREKVIKWRDMSDDQMRLQCGEMTTQEIRTVRAVLSAICPRQ